MTYQIQLKKQCLTTDTREANDLRPAKFRTQADSNQKKICYYIYYKKDASFNCFLAVKKQTSTISDTTFSIAKPLDKTNNNNSIYFEINHELINFNNYNFNRPVQQIRESDTRRETSTDGRQE